MPVSMSVSEQSPMVEQQKNSSSQSYLASVAAVQSVATDFTRAVIGRKHFGNPIPKEWYAASGELLGEVQARLPREVSHSESHGGLPPDWTFAEHANGQITIHPPPVGPGAIALGPDEHGLSSRILYAMGKAMIESRNAERQSAKAAEDGSIKLGNDDPRLHAAGRKWIAYAQDQRDVNDIAAAIWSAIAETQRILTVDAQVSHQHESASEGFGESALGERQRG